MNNLYKLIQPTWRHIIQPQQQIIKRFYGKKSEKI